MNTSLQGGPITETEVSLPLKGFTAKVRDFSFSRK
jgi:hypothetical protein